MINVYQLTLLFYIELTALCTKLKYIDIFELAANFKHNHANLIFPWHK